jgi:hypothetical protein
METGTAELCSAVSSCRRVSGKFDLRPEVDAARAAGSGIR